MRLLMATRRQTVRPLLETGLSGRPGVVPQPFCATRATGQWCYVGWQLDSCERQHKGALPPPPPPLARAAAARGAAGAQRSALILSSPLLCCCPAPPCRAPNRRLDASAQATRCRGRCTTGCRRARRGGGESSSLATCTAATTSCRCMRAAWEAGAAVCIRGASRGGGSSRVTAARVAAAPRQPRPTDRLPDLCSSASLLPALPCLRVPSSLCRRC